MAAFDDVRLPENIEVGADGGPTFSTGVITMANGQEQRVQNWSVSRNAYTVGYGISESDWPAVLAFFYARRGRARGFRFKDWTDYVASDQLVGNDLSLTKTYIDPVGLTYVRGITRVVPGTLRLHDGNGLDLTEYYTEQYGLLTALPTLPAHGQLLADFEYDLPVRFDIDELSITAETFRAASLDGIKIVELIESSAKLNGL